MPTAIDGGTDNGALRIGLVNNMPDAALGQTERQFRSLLARASEGIGPSVELSLYFLPGVPRSAAAGAWLRERSADVGTLFASPADGPDELDGLIVTGAEPRTQRLPDEPYWDDLTRVHDWAGENTYSTVWSCLAAHAAVLAADGIERVRQERKIFGVLECSRAADHPLLEGLGQKFPVPHSRWNSLSEPELGASGYTVLARTENSGVDLFVRGDRSLFVYLQGHPEYASDTLLREYRRDLGRYLAGEMTRRPALPLGCFDIETTASLEALVREGRLDEAGRLVGKLDPPHTWQTSAVALYRNWLGLIASAKALAVDNARLALATSPDMERDTVWPLF